MIKHGSTTTHQNLNNKQNSEDPVEMHQSGQKHNNRLKRLWLWFFGIPVAFFLSTIRKKENQSTATISVHYWIIERRNHKKKASFVERKMHLFARQCTSSQIDKNGGKNK